MVAGENINSDARGGNGLEDFYESRLVGTKLIQRRNEARGEIQLKCTVRIKFPYAPLFTCAPVENSEVDERQRPFINSSRNWVRPSRLLTLLVRQPYMHNSFVQFIKRKQDQTPPLMLSTEYQLSAQLREAISAATLLPPRRLYKYIHT